MVAFKLEGWHNTDVNGVALERSGFSGDAKLGQLSMRLAAV